MQAVLSVALSAVEAGFSGAHVAAEHRAGMKSLDISASICRCCSRFALGTHAHSILCSIVQHHMQQPYAELLSRD